MFTRTVIIVGIAVALLGATHPQPAQAACNNYVGGICLDKKKTQPAKRKKSTRKKAVKTQRKAVAADKCVSVAVTPNGAGRSNIVIRNGCGQPTRTFMAPLNCKQRLELVPAVMAIQKRDVDVKPNSKLTIRMVHPLLTNEMFAEVMAFRHRYASQKGTPAFGC